MNASRIVFCLLLFTPFASVLGQSVATPSARRVDPDEGIRFRPPSAVMITNANIMVGTRLIAGGDMLVDEGRIIALGEDLEPPEGTEVIDFQGDYVYPAFVDPLVEVDAGAVAENGSHWSANILPQRRAAEGFEIDNALLGDLRSAGVALIAAVPNSGIIKGQSCALTTQSAPLSESLVADTVFQHARLFPDRGARGVYPNSPMGAMALVRQTLADAQWYQQAVRASAANPSIAPPEFNAALAALAPVLGGQQSIVIDGRNELYALRADAIAREFGLKLVIQGSGREYRRLDAIAATGRALIVPLNFPDAPELDSEEDLVDATLQELMGWHFAPMNAAKLSEAGVSFAVTTSGLDDRKDFLASLRKAVKHGLSADAALAAATSVPASLLGVDDVAGSLGRGKLANFLRVDGELFNVKSTLKETWVAGTRHVLKSSDSHGLQGDWELSIDSTELPQLTLQVKGEGKGAKVSIGTAAAFDDSKDKAESESEESAEKPARLEDGSVDEYAIQGKFTVGQWGLDQQGTAFINATVITQGEQVSLDGLIVWPDGTKTSLTGQRPAAATEKASQEESDKDRESEPSDEEKTDGMEIALNYPLGAYGVYEPPTQHEWVVFKNATIWTCGPDGVLENADLLLHQGRIAEIGQKLSVPQGALVIDVSGKHISPGIIDCHSHMATDGGVNESGQAVTAEVRIGDFIDPNDITIYRQLAGGVTASNILHGSANPIGGQNQVIKLRWGALPEEMKMSRAPGGIKFALGENVKQSNRGDDFRTRYPQTRMGVEQIMRDRFDAALDYRERWQNWSTSPEGLPPRKDYELEAIAEILEGSRWIHCHSYRQDEILTTLRVLEDYGVTIGSLQHILEGYKVADAMAKHGATGSSFSDWWAYKFEVYDAIPYNGALMHNAGVIVSFNSDDRELARHLNHEAAKAVKYGGVPEQEALKFVTLNPAKQLRIDQWTGSLEVGKDADIAVWNRPPLSTLSVCEQTWVDGRKYFDRQDDLVRRRKDEELRMRLVQRIVSSGASTGPRRDDDPSYWWARFDEFCHHFDGHDYDHSHDHADE